MRRSTFQKLNALNASVDVTLSREVVSQYDEIKTVSDNIDAVVQVAAVIPTLGSVLAARDATAADVVTVEAGVVDALRYTELAQQWAEEDYNVLVDSEGYSAKHWAQIAEESAGTGVIDDTLINTTRTWSSSKMHEEFEPHDTSILKEVDIGVTIQGYSADTVHDAIYVHTDNNYTTNEKNKLAGIATGAEVNVNADWNVATGDAAILNKPTTISGYGITDAYTKTEVQTNLPKIGLSLTNTTPPAAGQLAWNIDEKTIDVGINGVTLQLGQELITMVRNGTAGTIVQGTVCMSIGTVGASGRIVVTKADMSDPMNAYRILGIATEDIVAGSDGFITYFGKVRTINTSGWSAGDLLYVSNSVPGGLTNVLPTSGVKQSIARVINSHATVGTLMVRVALINELAYEPKNTNLQAHLIDLSNPHMVSKTQVGLGLVDNTADVIKNVATAAKLFTARTMSVNGDVTGSTSFDGSANVTTTLTLASSGAVAGTYTKVAVDAKGRVTSGSALIAADIPVLDASKITSGTIDAARLPSYVDDVLEFATLSVFPATGIAGKIYVDLATNKTYRWSGTVYVYITSGAVDSVAGKTGVVTLVKGDVGLSSVDNTADTTKNVLSATKLTTARTITLAGDATGSVSFDGSSNASINVTVVNDSHTHTFANVTNRPTTVSGYGITDAYTKSEMITELSNKLSQSNGVIDLGNITEVVS